MKHLFIINPVSGGKKHNPSVTEEMIKKGLAQGLSLMCMTDHLDMDYPYSDVSFDLDADAYFREMHRLQKAYHDRIEIRIGAELGIQPQLGDAYRQWLSDKSFDFLIGGWGSRFFLQKACRSGGRGSEAADRKGQRHRNQHRRLQGRTF